ncbi:hypothetical protein EDEG_01589 [Edhazardia aedis USNM 41457]|uniref:Uncharacterized protein n=1 Tax=Edhazardia aedis (strain USNM 41457) TaxID=1003232 RepID=J9D9E6_EDHAE|nr:hypothetical protein EDEG_01589 [Edhazardia aedis USNM 41457]|eukprot:EJW04109.1 hypothetical protein EDEG_01589 [Edhazardia aedis USNM 41457]
MLKRKSSYFTNMQLQCSRDAKKIICFLNFHTIYLRLFTKVNHKNRICALIAFPPTILLICWAQDNLFTINVFLLSKILFLALKGTCHTQCVTSKNSNDHSKYLVENSSVNHIYSCISI